MGDEMDKKNRFEPKILQENLQEDWQTKDLEKETVLDSSSTGLGIYPSLLQQEVHHAYSY